MIPSHAMLVTDGSTIGDNFLRRCPFQFPPAVQSFLVSTALPEHIGGIDAAALGVDMGKMSENMNSFSIIRQGTAKG